MMRRTVRARVRGRHPKPLEELALAEGAEVTLTVEVPEGVTGRTRPKLSVWYLGAPAGLSRNDYHGDAE